MTTPVKKTNKTLFSILLLTTMSGSPFAQSLVAYGSIVWRLNDTSWIGGLKPFVLGAPQVVSNRQSAVLSFDGKDDGLILPVNPLQGWGRFIVEILFNPAADGPVAPRLLHGEDSAGNRFTIEARITPGGSWYLDTFLKTGKTGKGLTLVDSTRLHPCGRWYWAALTYDGTTMTHYVNAVKEAEGTVNFGPMTGGKTAVAVRLNRVNWFKGAIAKLRFGAGAATPPVLQRYKD